MGSSGINAGVHGDSQKARDNIMVDNPLCPPSAPFFGFMGAAVALIFANLGAAYGTAKSGVGVSSMGVMKPDLVMKPIIPVVMAGVPGIYGLIIAVIIANQGVASLAIPRPPPCSTSSVPPIPPPFCLPKLVRLNSSRLILLLPSSRDADPCWRGPVLLVHRFCAPGGRSRVWPERHGCGHCDRHCGRCGRARFGSAGQAVRGHGPHSHLRRGARSLRPYRRPHPHLQGLKVLSCPVWATHLLPREHCTPSPSALHACGRCRLPFKAPPLREWRLRVCHGRMCPLYIWFSL